MISTKFLVQTWQEIPENWIFEYYCKLDEKLSGQDVKIQSLFNPNERTPSMCIFYSNEKSKYLFKDFSTGKSGDAMRLVQELHNETFSKTSTRVIKTYNDYVLLNNGVEHKITDFKVKSKYRVTEHALRQWSTADQDYWSSFGLPSKMLEHYNIKPLEYYKMSKEGEAEPQSLEIRGQFIYGYFQNDGTLYKIYQPKNKQYKFIKVKDYRQGSEQMMGKKYLIVCSSLKDGMVIRLLCKNVDVVVPDSENTLIKDAEMYDYLRRYQRVFTLFDNDKAGIDAMKKYKNTYGVDFLYIPLEKDIADAVKEHGVEKVKETLLITIIKKLNQ